MVQKQTPGPGEMGLQLRTYLFFQRTRTQFSECRSVHNVCNSSPLSICRHCTHRHRPTDRHSHVHIIKSNTNNLRKTPTLLHKLSSPESLLCIKAMNLGLVWVKSPRKSEKFSTCGLWLLWGGGELNDLVTGIPYQMSCLSIFTFWFRKIAKLQ